MIWVVKKRVHRVMPVQKPGKSKQHYGTDPLFLNAVRERFGPLVLDLAASKKNTVAPACITKAEDSLKVSWEKAMPEKGNAWLNPPFGRITPWALKCKIVMRCRGPESFLERILFLTPASVGSNWFELCCFNDAAVLLLKPRLVFVGETHPYPKDLILSVFGEKPGVTMWRWR
jgi:phage N-6-adenine-methyltransferase